MTRHRYDCHVRFSDVDIFGHVNNVKYFEYYQEARLVFLSALRPGALDDFGIVVARLDVDYKRPILFRTEPYAVESWITRVGTSSFTIRSEITDGAQVLSRAEAVLVTFDLEAQRARALSVEERSFLLAAVEG